MKKINLLVVISLVFFSLACLSTAATSSIESESSIVAERTLTNAPAAAATSTTTPAPTLAPIDRCAVVVAIESLHLRGGPSEAAEVLTWLNHGVVVELVSDSDPDWWRVKLDDLEGYSRSIYLQESECVK